ncbi:hypothetical protein HDU92_005349 [Lobulomyces angularis]|nr:hypothetical protein HDU92_005349 [Lobulomyces angularis]
MSLLDEFDNQTEFSTRKNTTLVKERKEISDSLGDLLLKGWKMLNEACEICLVPLMEDREGKVICVSCVNKKKEVLETPEKVISSVTLNKKEKDDEAENVDRISNLIGEKLLVGWVLLNETCPCGVPLMKNKAGEKICVVGCGKQEKGKQVLDISAPTLNDVSTFIQSSNLSEELKETITLLSKKLSFLIKKLDDSTNVEEIKSICETINCLNLAIKSCLSNL